MKTKQLLTTGCQFWMVSLLAAVMPALATPDMAPGANNAVQSAAAVWLDASFVVPERYAVAGVVLVKVDPALAEQDYQALLQAKVQIRQDLGTAWPEDNLKLADNKASLVNDLQAFEQRTNFTYHLLEQTTGQVIGCVYISQNGDIPQQAVLYYWLIPKYQQSPAHLPIRQGLQQWLKTAWPFQSVDFSLNGHLPAPTSGSGQ